MGPEETSLRGGPTRCKAGSAERLRFEGIASGDYDLFFGVLDSEGNPAGTPLPLNDFTAGAQTSASLAPSKDGGFVACWHSQFQDGDGYGIVAQFLNATGAKQGKEFVVNTKAAGAQSGPDIALLNSGSFVVVWTDGAPDPEDNAVKGQILSATGEKVGGEFQVDVPDEGLQFEPSVSAAPDGGFLVAYISHKAVVLRKFAADLTVVWDEQVVGEGVGWTSTPRVSGFQDGSAVVAWIQGMDNKNEEYAVFSRRYGPSGTPKSAKTQVQAFTPLKMSNPNGILTLAAHEDGSYLLAWHSEGQDGDGLGVFAQRFDAAGKKLYH